MSLTSSGGWLEFRFRVVGAGRSWGVAALVAVLALTGSAIASDRWIRDYDQAMAEAERTGRPVLTLFTGSDWCPHCVTLEKKVLDSSLFLEWAQDRVILLMIDLPQQGISQEERNARSRVCIKYGVRSFPNTILIAPDGAKIMGQSGYQGQSPEAWLTAFKKHVPAPILSSQPADAEGDQVLSTMDDAVETARDTRKPMLLLVSRPGDAGAKTKVTSLIQDPDFNAFARDNFVVAQVSPRDESNGTEGVSGDLLGGEDLAADDVEVIVTEDGSTPIHVESGGQPAHRIVTGLRRFLANRQASRHAETIR